MVALVPCKRENIPFSGSRENYVNSEKPSLKLVWDKFEYQNVGDLFIMFLISVKGDMKHHKSKTPAQFSSQQFE